MIASRSYPSPSRKISGDAFCGRPSGRAPYLDTAFTYGNESEIGKALASHGVARAQVSIMTKLPGRCQGLKAARECLLRQRNMLGLDYIDVYLIHWPLPQLDLFVQSWEALIEAQQDEVLKTIGVSNFTR
jgi:diketogulonate reductase-like aldo/keto reductase